MRLLKISAGLFILSFLMGAQCTCEPMCYYDDDGNPMYLTCAKPLVVDCPEGCDDDGNCIGMTDCSDYRDNDGDDMIDLDDPGCEDPPDISELAICEDGMDNDGDNLIDMDDYECIDGNPGNGEEGLYVLANQPVLNSANNNHFYNPNSETTELNPFKATIIQDYCNRGYKYSTCVTGHPGFNLITYVALPGQDSCIMDDPNTDEVERPSGGFIEYKVFCVNGCLGKQAFNGHSVGYCSP